MPNDELIQVFLEESEEEIKELEAGLISLEEDPDNIDTDNIGRIFRSAHTIKGSAGMVGFEDVANFTHNLENILDKVRNNELKVTKNLITSLLEGVDFLKGLISATINKEDIDSAKMQSITSRLKRFASPLLDEADESSTETKVVPGGVKERVYAISMRFRPDIFMTGQDPLMLLHELYDMGEIVEIYAHTEGIPDFYALEPTNCYIWWEIIIRTEQPLSNLKNVFIFVEDENEIHIDDITEKYTDGGNLDLAEKPIGEILVEKGIIKEEDLIEALREHKTTGQQLVEKGKAPKDIVENVARIQSRSRKVVRSKTIRVDTEKLDKLVNLVGEMVISVARMVQFSTAIKDPLLFRSFETSSAALERVSRELQEQVMRVRMIPVEGTFNRFRRLVRDLAFEQGKKIELKMSGTETELDKNVVEQIGDPLKHMIRNSIDHGIETPEERKAKGKPETGTIWLKAYQEEGSIFIEIADDGRGIDKDRLLAKAIEKGIADASQQYSEEDIFNFMFAPGLSTAEKVTEISGRGVGMDVVKKNIEDLRGSIEVISSKDMGTVFRVRFPLTLAIIDSMTVRVGKEVFTVPLSVIEKSLRPGREDIKTVEGKGELIDIRGEYIPLVRLYELFNIIPEKTDPTEAFVVVLQGTASRFGVLVDDILGLSQAVIKSIDKNFRKIEGTSGATILGDGKVSLILDIHGMERLAFNDKRNIRIFKGVV